MRARDDVLAIANFLFCDPILVEFCFALQLTQPPPTTASRNANLKPFVRTVATGLWPVHGSRTSRQKERPAGPWLHVTSILPLTVASGAERLNFESTHRGITNPTKGPSPNSTKDSSPNPTTTENRSPR